MKRYRCTFTGEYQPEANRQPAAACEYTYDEVYDRWPHVVSALDALDVGRSAMDEDGDTWERIA